MQPFGAVLRYDMGMKLRIMQSAGKTYYQLWCPGCNDLHQIDETWGFDGNREKPTFSPSILTWEGDWPDHPNPADKRPKTRCHSFVREGKWAFLDDSTHALAGKTVPMVDFPDSFVLAGDEI